MPDFSTDEMLLALLALKRWRTEIDVDGSNKCPTMNEGQKQACRYTMVHVDGLIDKLEYHTKIATGTEEFDQ